MFYYIELISVTKKVWFFVYIIPSHNDLNIVCLILLRHFRLTGLLGPRLISLHPFHNTSLRVFDFHLIQHFSFFSYAQYRPSTSGSFCLKVPKTNRSTISTKLLVFIDVTIRDTPVRVILITRPYPYSRRRRNKS